MSNEPTVNIDKFLGLYNKQQSRRLPVGALTYADNIDVDDTGGIIRRQGYSKSIDLTNVTSTYATQDERRLFVVNNGNLCLLHPDGSQDILWLGVGFDYVYWVEVADYIILSTGQIINGINVVSEWRLPTPHQPNIGLTQGNLSKGQYQVGVTLVDISGREGGASPTAVIDVDEGQGLVVEPDIPVGYTARVYVTDGNGSVLYFVDDTSTSLTINQTSHLTSPIDEAQIGAYPAPDNATILAHYESKLWAAVPGDVSVIWYSEPFWWNLFKMQENFITVPGWVRMMVGHRDGLIIATDDEIYIYNDSLSKVADYGVPAGKPYSIDDKGNVFIWTKQGVCTALPFQNLTEQKLSLAAGDVCYTEVVEQNGFSKFVVLTDAEGTADNQLL